MQCSLVMGTLEKGHQLNSHIELKSQNHPLVHTQGCLNQDTFIWSHGVHCSTIILYNYLYVCSFAAAISVMKVSVNVSPFDHVIPVVFNLTDDQEIEPMDIYQLTIVNFSDPRAAAGDMDTSYIIINDDDGKNWIE